MLNRPHGVGKGCLSNCDNGGNKFAIIVVNFYVGMIFNAVND